jgi:hypothetical protein
MNSYGHQSDYDRPEDNPLGLATDRKDLERILT